jgi:hypothetical protein
MYQDYPRRGFPFCKPKTPIMKRIITCFALLSILCIPLIASKAFENTIAPSFRLAENKTAPDISEIYGLVWFDSNADGIVDPGENGIPGVPVFLFSCSGAFVQSTLTDLNGEYFFDNLSDGSYKVFFNKSGLQSNYSFTYFDAPGIDNNAASNGFTMCFDTDEDEYLINAGLTVLSTIGDFVWDDLNGNGIQEAGEPGIPGVTVILYNATGNPLGQTVTDINGHYAFHLNFPGFYFLVFDAGSDYMQTQYNGTNNSNDSDISILFGAGATDLFQVTAGSDRLDQDAGFYRCATICGFVYSDNNTNDLLDLNENGINGLQILLWQITDDGPLLYEITQTGNQEGSPSADGFYTFCVAPGSYYAEINLHPSVDLVLGLPFEGIDPEAYNHFDESNGPLTTYTVDLLSGDIACGLNAGLYCGGRFTNTIWLDTDFNGLRDENEPPMSGIDVAVYNDAFIKVRETQTDSNGIFSLDSLRKGNYYLSFSQPEGLEFTIPFADGGFISALDCDVDNSFGPGTTPMYFLGGCETMLGLGAGFTSGVLPVRWLDMRVEKTADSHIVEWETASEHQSSRYEILRSFNKADRFQVIGSVPSMNNVNGGKYHFNDIGVNNSGLYYYKIKHVSYDNTVEYSNTMYLISQSSGAVLEIIPNPASHFLLLNTGNANPDQLITISIINASGQKMLQDSFIQPGDSQRQLDISSLPSGIYLLQIDIDKKPMVRQKLIIAR